MSVYFIKPMGTNTPVKIGCSARPSGRRSILEMWSPFPLEIVAEIEGSFDLEARFHAKFEALHSHKEWFHCDRELQRVIDEIKAGTFDIAELPAPKILISEAKRNIWTEDRRKQLSVTLRASRMRDRSGFRFRGDVYAVLSDPDTAAAFKQYLAAPHIHGEPDTWMRDRQAAWLVKAA